MTGNDSAMDGLGEKIKLDPDMMDDLSTRFLKDADDFDSRMGGVREAMTASTGGDGWGSAQVSPLFAEILSKHRRELRDAESFMATVTDDMATMGRNTRALKSALLGEDGHSATVLNSLYPTESKRDDGDAPIVRI